MLLDLVKYKLILKQIILETLCCISQVITTVISEIFDCFASPKKNPSLTALSIRRVGKRTSDSKEEGNIPVTCNTDTNLQQYGKSDMNHEVLAVMGKNKHASKW